MTARPTAIVAGMIATYPVGGVVWDYGQYALGLEQLGYDVYYVEDTAGPTYDPRARIVKTISSGAPAEERRAV